MTLFRAWCVLIFVSIFSYTLITIGKQGLNLFPYFFGDMASMEWPGQFNFDFMFMLSLSAIWTMWRNQFSGAGVSLGVLAFFFGAPFLSAYLLFLSFKHKGDALAMLVGDRELSLHGEVQSRNGA